MAKLKKKLSGKIAVIATVITSLVLGVWLIPGLLEPNTIKIGELAVVLIIWLLAVLYLWKNIDKKK